MQRLLTDPGTKSQTTLKFCLNIFKRKCTNWDLLQTWTQLLTNQSCHDTHSCGGYCLANTRRHSVIEHCLRWFAILVTASARKHVGKRKLCKSMHTRRGWVSVYPPENNSWEARYQLLGTSAACDTTALHELTTCEAFSLMFFPF